MHTRLLVGPLALLVGLALAAPARAGIYHPAEPMSRLPSTWKEYKDHLDQLRSIGSPPVDPNGEPNPYRRAYLERAAFLEALRDRGLLTVEDRINLSAYYLRLNQAAKAKETLEAIPEEQRNFMVFANLATAYFLSDMLDRALLTQQEALDAWPESWPGWSRGELVNHRRCELYFLNLLKARKQEPPRRPGDPIQDVDAVFLGVKFVGADGQFQVGGISLKQWDKLPLESDKIMQQLVLWLPFDDRLYWLLAEVLNAQNLPLIAGDIMDELEYKRQFPPRLLHRNRLVLMDDEVRKTLQAMQTDPMAGAGTMAMWFATPHGAGLLPGVAGAYSELGFASAVPVRFPNPPPQPDAQTPAGSPAGPTVKSSYLPDIGATLIGLAVGIVVGVLLTLQVRAMQKPQTPAAKS